jgi:hypothetical protein
MGMFGTPDPAYLPPPVVAGPADVPRGADGRVPLLPVQMADAEVDPAPAPASIEVVFACATVQIAGSPKAATLRTVLDTLARHS